MDCTFCLDCVHACPHDNVGLIAGLPAADLWHDRQRSGVGRFGRRPDMAVLVVVLVFGAFANAAGMVGPVLAWQDRLAAAAGMGSLRLLSCGTLPDCSCRASVPAGRLRDGACRRWWGRLTDSCPEVVTRYAYALIPLGFAMWLAHYSFHFLTSYAMVIPTAQRFIADRGMSLIGAPDWGRACCVAVPGWLLRAEIVALELGLLLSLYTGHRIALAQERRLSRAWAALAPWAALHGHLVRCWDLDCGSTYADAWNDADDEVNGAQ